MICKRCGDVISSVGRTCGACGTWNDSQSDSTPVAQDYLMEIKRLTRSVPFLLGCLLITVGTVGNIFFGFTWQNILDIAFATVHIAALWILVLEAFSHTAYKKTLTALAMFKVSVVLNLILICIVFGITGIAVLFATMQGISFLFLLAIVGGIGYLIIKYFFLALLKVLNAIKERITTGKYTPLDGLGSFLVLSYIGIGVSVVNAFTSMFVDIYYDTATYFPPAAGMVINDTTVEPFVFSWGIIFVIANGIGMVLCLRTLKRYA
ncbi:MAG: hypothetical protein FWB88_00325 [Defluviitaleaceae bacterium]|nr:hypothetical protein [Defluviitaleaceae bacterium]MCL2239087.1 hypothetical protein [Defluviitaleaceae bacterium]